MADYVTAVPTFSGDQAETPKKGTRSRPVKVRKHAFDSINSRLLTAFLDKLHLEGGVVLAINQSQAIGGNYEIVSYKES